MCEVKKNKDVQTESDLQNLVTSVILRQEDSFNVEQIYDFINADLCDSKYKDEQNLIKPLIKYTCQSFKEKDFLSSSNGKYSFKGVQFL